MADIATWYGVTVENGDVVALDLSDNNLSGSLPAAVGDLAALEYLNLGSNQITGVPGQIGRLRQLVSLSIDNNQLTTLPRGFTNLRALEYLNLDNNQLTALPAEIGRLTKLISAHLKQNQLTTLPISVGQMSRLENLFLFRNPLTSIPAELAQAPRFRGLFVQETQLKSLPAAFSQIATLEFLNASNSALESLPLMDNMPLLRGVILSGNNLRSIPDFSNHPNRADLAYRVENNLLDLNYLAQHLTGPGSTALKKFTYEPQRSTEEAIEVPGLTLAPFPAHPQSSYRWQQRSGGGWQDIAGATQATYTVGSITDEQYRVIVTNAWLPGMEQRTVIQPVAGTAPSSPWVEAECASVGSNWQVVEDTEAAGGKYVVYPNGSGNSTRGASTDPADHVTFTVAVAQAGTYQLHARVRAPSDNDDSFWVRINQGSWQQWAGGVRSNSFAWKQVRGQSYALVAGTNTITFAHREDGTQLDKLYVMMGGEVPQGVGEDDPACSEVPDSPWLETECASVGSNWQTVEDTNAAGGKYVVYPQGNSPRNASTDPNDHIVFTTQVPEAGSYKLFARVRAPNQNDDSFWVKVGDNDWEKWFDGVRSSSFAWRTVMKRRYQLAAGPLTITFAHREDGAQLDKLHLTTANNAPGGTGEEDPRCEDQPPVSEVPGEPLDFAPQWGGNVSAMVWSTFHYEQPVYQQAYTYDYSRASRLTDARYASHDTDGGWSANQSNYSLRNVSYDANGNITDLTRYTAAALSADDDTPVRRLMDQLSYTYAGQPCAGRAGCR